MTQNDNHLDGIIDAAMEIAVKRAAVVRDMKQAIQSGRLRDALLCACRLAGIDPTDAIHRLKDPQPARDEADPEASRHVM